jgi:hypothetical protein
MPRWHFIERSRVIDGIINTMTIHIHNRCTKSTQWETGGRARSGEEFEWTELESCRPCVTCQDPEENQKCQSHSTDENGR